MDLDHRTKNVAQVAAAAWNTPLEQESMESVEKRIHDGADDLDFRANEMVHMLFSRFPHAEPKASFVNKLRTLSILEIGGGIGTIMQAMASRLEANGITRFELTDLDIAENMLARAKIKLAHDPRFKFSHYDGVNVPFSDGKFDLIYSVSSLQHVPKEYVYNLLFEIKRILKPNGRAIIHLLSFRDVPDHTARVASWRQEVNNLIEQNTRHWHFFYSDEEVETVLRETGFSFIEINHEACLLFCAGR